VPITRAKPIVDTSSVITDVRSDCDALGSIRPGDWVQLRRQEPEHADKNVIVLSDYKGRRLGRISPELSRSVGPHMAAGWRTFCLISQVVAVGSERCVQASVIVFCYDRRDDELVRPALLNLATRIRKDMQHSRYVAVPSPKRRGSFHGLPVAVIATEEPAYQLRK
jgi:hypothetical protein